MESTIIKDEMLKFFSQLNDAEQQSVLNMVKTFLKSRYPISNTTGDFYPVTMEEYNKELEEADAEIEAGDFVTHEEVKRLFSR